MYYSNGVSPSHTYTAVFQFFHTSGDGVSLIPTSQAPPPVTQSHTEARVEPENEARIMFEFCYCRHCIGLSHW